MLAALLQGCLLGLALAILLGPAFFTLLQTSIDRGFRSAVKLAIGISASDLFLVGLILFGASSVLNNDVIKDVVGLVGGGILIGFGAYTFMSRGASLNKKRAHDPHLSPKLPHTMVFVIKGFLLNLANPATWFFWLFWVGVITSQYSSAEGIRYMHLIAFFAATLVTVFLTDVLKSYIAHQIKDYITDRIMSVINMIVGIILLGFGVYLVVVSVMPFLSPKVIEIIHNLKALN